MAVKIELKRSAVPGKVPTVDQLDLGELAINTYDGTVYLKQDTTVSQSIIQLATTVGSGSSVTSASYAQYASTAGSAASASFATFALSAESASYSLTASYLPGLNLNSITTGSITASVNIDPAHLFLIKSGSTDYFNIASDSTVTSYSNLFVIKNFTTQQPVFTVSQSVVLIATQSVAPTVSNGGFWFTATDLYVGLDDSGIAP